MADFYDIAREGWLDAAEGEPLFEDADHAYGTGWCIYHGIGYPFETGQSPTMGSDLKPDLTLKTERFLT